MRRSKEEKNIIKWVLPLIFILVLVFGGGAIWGIYFHNNELAKTTIQNTQSVIETTQQVSTTIRSDVENWAQKLDELKAINTDTIGYVYAPGTKLDEPIVQTSDNSTYLSKTFEGGYDPIMGTVFMDRRNSPDFSNQLTWLFGHARGSAVPDNRMFNDVNFYIDQKYFDEHPYVVVHTPEKTYYYEAAFFIVVPERTAFYKTKFNNNEEFVSQLKEVRRLATTSNPNINISETDKYLVLSTCREEDPTIRTNLYLRQIPDNEVSEFLNQNKDKLTYQKTR